MLRLKICACNRCQHEWASRKKEGEPKQCPSCHSPYYAKKRVYRLKRLAYA